MSFILQLSYHSHFEARSWEWLFKRRLGTKIGVCSCTVCSSAHVQFTQRLLKHTLLTLLMYTLLICLCTVCSSCSCTICTTSAHALSTHLLMHCVLICTVHSLLIPCTQRCTALHNLCSSCFEFCLAHPTLTLLSADHAQTTSDHVCTLHCSSYHCLVESWSCSKTALLFATSAHHTSKFALIILPLHC